MSTQKVKAHPTNVWSDISGAASGLAGVTWINRGISDVLLAFQTAQPVNEDSSVLLKRGEAYYDKNGSGKVWAYKLWDLPATVVAVVD